MTLPEYPQQPAPAPLKPGVPKWLAWVSAGLLALCTLGMIGSYFSPTKNPPPAPAPVATTSSLPIGLSVKEACERFKATIGGPAPSGEEATLVLLAWLDSDDADLMAAATAMATGDVSAASSLHAIIGCRAFGVDLT